LAALAALLFACALAMPSPALANNVGDAGRLPALGGDVPLTIPADAHQVYTVDLRAGDWLVGYSWAPGTEDATATLRVLGPSATDVASDTVAASSPSGILFWQAPADGVYYCDFAGDPGTRISTGLFTSRPTLSVGSASTVVVPYNGDVVLSCVFTDPLYSYVPYDGPTIGFETVGLSSSRDGVSWKRTFAGSTDVLGRLSHKVTGLTHEMVFSFDYDGAVYDSAGFGEARSAAVTVVPRFRITEAAPTRVRHGVGFSVTGTMQPTRLPGLTSAEVQAYK
jgi:hypothetical protein